MFVHAYIPVPSCYVTTNCIGDPINSSITYSDCCMNFGVSYDLDGRCQPCPNTSKCITSILHKFNDDICLYTYVVHIYIFGMHTTGCNFSL